LAKGTSGGHDDISEGVVREETRLSDEPDKKNLSSFTFVPGAVGPVIKEGFNPGSNS
jgi:hypothetical protein